MTPTRPQRIHATRYTGQTGIGYKLFGLRHWQHIDTNDGEHRAVGPIYPSKEYLLLDHVDYLRRAGWMKAKPEVQAA